MERQVLDALALSRESALSANGKLVAASRGGVVCLWQTATGKRLRHLRTGLKRVVCLAFSADGKRLLTIGPSARVAAIWDVATGKCVRRSEGKQRAGYGRSAVIPYVEQNAIASPGLRYLAYQWRHPSGNKKIHIRDLATGKELPSIHLGGHGGPLAFCFSGDEKTLVWDDWYPAGGIVFSDVRTGKELRRLGDRRSEKDVRSEVTLALALSPDGKSAAVCRQSHTIELWDLASGKWTCPVGKPTREQLVHWFTDYVGANVRPALAFSPDGKRLVCSLGGATIRQFRTDTGKEIPGPVSGLCSPVSSLTLSADGKSLCTYGIGDPARVWNWTTGKETTQRGIPASATHAAFAANGRLAFAVGNQVTLCGAGSKKTWRVAPGEYPPLMGFALSCDGTVLATRNHDNPEVRLWDAQGKHLHTLSRAEPQVGDGSTEAAGVVTPELLFSPDGRWLAGAGPRLQLCLWDVARGTLLWEVSPQAGQATERLAFSPGGQVLAAVDADGTVTLYEALTGGMRTRLGKADRKKRTLYQAYNYYGKLRLWPTRRAAPVCAAFSPDGRYLALAKDSPAIGLWDVLAGREVGRLEGHEGGVVSLLCSPDGKHLLSGGTDTTALTWDLARLTPPRPTRADWLGPKALETLWANLASKDAARAFTASRKLCASPDQAVTLIKERVHPAKSVSVKVLARLLTDLQSEQPEPRRKAASELEGLGELAEPALRKALADDPPLGPRLRLERLRNLAGKAPPAERLRALRAVELLELIGSGAARRVLRGLAGGEPGARLTRQARSAGQRLARQSTRR
jgi:WD40 repeat protein